VATARKNRQYLRCACCGVLSSYVVCSTKCWRELQVFVGALREMLGLESLQAAAQRRDYR
jgi:hypothetical protein